MFLSTWQPQPILVSFDGIHIYWYGLFLAVGAMVGLLLILRLGRTTLPSSSLVDLFVMLVVGGFVGGRLYHVLNEWGYYQAHPTEIWQVWNGGLAIHGAMIVGLVLLWLYARRQQVSAWLLTDVFVVGLAAGQAIGRWGNYFNQELFGRPTSLPWKIIIDEAHRPTGLRDQQFFHPTFLYESLGCAILCALLFTIVWYRQKNPAPIWTRPWRMAGSVTLTYFILYSLLRIGMESLRIDRVPIVAGLRLPLLTSFTIIVAAVVIWAIRLMNQRHDQPS